MWKYYGVSVPVVLFCLWIAFNLMLFYFWMQVNSTGVSKELAKNLDKNKVLRYLGCVADNTKILLTSFATNFPLRI